MQKRVVLVRHGNDPPDDRVHTFLLTNGFEPVVRKPFAGEPIGELDESIVGSVIYGGKYAVYETGRYPFLNEQYRWIDSCLKAGIPLLGICQGAQQIAWHLGAEVGPVPGDPCEFGYYRISPAAGAGDFLTAPIHVTQSHFHTFRLPKDAELLATGDLFPIQAFRYGRKVYGLQFHAEVTIEGFRRWQEAPWAYYGRLGAQSRAEQDRLMHLHDAAQADWFYGFLGRLFGSAERAT